MGGLGVVDVMVKMQPSDGGSVADSLDQADEVMRSADITLDSHFEPIRMQGKSRVGRDEILPYGGDRFRPSSSAGEDAELRTEKGGPACVIVRASVDTCDPREIEGSLIELNRRSEVISIYSDPEIAPYWKCWRENQPENLSDMLSVLNLQELSAVGMDGDGVDVAVVDGGIDADYLVQRSRDLKPLEGWHPDNLQNTPGQYAVNNDRDAAHGTMCAHEVLLASPRARILDYALLRRAATVNNKATMSGLDIRFSHAIAAYHALASRLRKDRRSNGGSLSRPLVVTNSWGLGSVASDEVTNRLGRYRDQFEHPFNLAVEELSLAGADIVFAAGNNGQPHPDDSTWPQDELPITGANSHPLALCVGAVTVGGERICYSSQGPGRLFWGKPDVMGYSEYVGSEVLGSDTPDVGTSAACPLVAGVIAAVRSKIGTDVLSPVKLREAVRCSAWMPSVAGHCKPNSEYGWGIIDPSALLAGVREHLTQSRE